MPKPSHIFIGPDKTGSSWLHEALLRHPEVYVPTAKDLYYFDKYYDRGDIWYESHFSAGALHRARVDISHDYLMSPDAPGRIRSYSDSIGLFTILRHPVDRAISHFQYLRRSGLVPADFTRALEIRPDIITNGLYTTHLARYDHVFGEGYVRLFSFPAMRDDPALFLRSICDFLGVTSADPEVPERQRAASEARFLPLAFAVKFAASAARELGFEHAIGAIKRNRLIQRLLYRELPPDYASDIAAEHGDALMERYYNKELELLRERYAIDLCDGRG